MAGLPQTMKAWTVIRAGLPRDALILQPASPAPPAPTGTDILVKVSHVALNPADPHYVRILPSWIPFRRYAVPGIDFAGTVVAAAPGVSVDSGVTVGDEVCGAVSFMYVATGRGTLAEYISLPADQVARRPEKLSLGAAAGLCGVAGQTALLVLKEAGLEEGGRVLINGASGGVGTVLVQICKSKGATVVGICSGANEDFVKKLGADEVVDYKSHQPLTAHLAATYEKEPFDFIFDTVGDQDLFSHSPKYLNPKGQLISIVGGSSNGVAPFVRNKLIPTFLGGTPRTYKILALAPNGPFAREVAGWAEKGLVKGVPIDAEFTMTQVIEAYEKLLTKRTKGKIIVDVNA